MAEPPSVHEIVGADAEILDAARRIIQIIEDKKVVSQMDLVHVMKVDGVLFRAAWRIARKSLIRVGAGRGTKWTLTAGRRV